jgi:hypothetical protein
MKFILLFNKESFGLRETGPIFFATDGLTETQLTFQTWATLLRPLPPHRFKIAYSVPIGQEC